ncbi:MAG TPA: hypothetical protein VGN13_12615 [Solirubrobacteraceae bacterium]|jgi:hypothetical protein
MSPTRARVATHSIVLAGAVVVLAGVALLLAGCGGSSPSPGVAHLSSHTSSSAGESGAGASSSAEGGGPTQQQMVAFSRCMRSHGVPEFPEPSEGRLLIRKGGANVRRSGVDPRSAQFQAARNLCGKLLPNGGVPSPAQQAEAQEAALKFSRCIRTHGVPNFPDPTFSANTVQLKGVGGPGGADLNSPQFKAAQKACQSIVPRGAKAGLAGGGAGGAAKGP